MLKPHPSLRQMLSIKRLFWLPTRSLRLRHASTSAITLRPYQEQCLDACTTALTSGSTRIGVSLPTGSGKTTVFISLLARIPPPLTNEKATKSLIIVNSIELARQSAEQVARLFPHWHVEIEQGAKHQATGLADVTIATYQTLNNEERLLKFDPKTMKAIIIDEAHHAAAPSYRRLLARFDPNIKHDDVEVSPEEFTHNIPIIGFSATFGRHDRLALSSVFEKIVYHRSFLEMIKEEWLCDVRFTTVKTNMDLDEVKVDSKTGDYNASSLAKIVNVEPMNEMVVRTWLDRASTRKSTLIFCIDVAHVQDLTQTFRRFGIDARYLSAKTPAAERKMLIQSFKDGEFPVLVNCAILTEGADIPNIDCVIVARPTRSRNLFAQMIGRGMRLSPNTGKTDCRVIDFVDIHQRVNSLVTSPTLFGLDPNKITVEDEDMSALESMAKAGNSWNIAGSGDHVPIPTSITYIDHEDPFRLAPQQSKIYRLSHFAYVDCGNDKYVLELLTKGFVRIEKEVKRNVYVGRYTPAAYFPNNAQARALGLSPYLPSREVVEHESLEEVVAACDTYIIRKIFHDTSTTALHQSASWRYKPASPAQVNFIKKRWEKQGTQFKSDDQESVFEDLNKGEAATIITRLRNGSQARFIKKAKVALKEKKETEKERLRKAREVVQVGPLAV